MTDQLRSYLEGLTVTQGRHAGRPLVVLPWQARFVRGALRSGVSTAALSVARGNGKTTLLAGVACAALDGPLAVPRGETILVAPAFEQARIAFDHVVAFMGDKLKDGKRWRVWDAANGARIENRETGARVKCIGSDPRRAHGLAPVLILADEPSQWPESTGERMLAAMVTALGKVPDGRLVALGTRPANELHWFAKMLDGGADFAQCHAAGPDDPPFQRRTWSKANPSLAHMPDLRAAIEREAKAAKADPVTLASFRAYRLNGGVDDTEVSCLLDAGTWERVTGPAERPQDGRGACWGLDLGTSAAMSAVAAFWPGTGALEALTAFPREPSLAERGLRDGVAGLYAECHRRGELIQCGGAAVDISELIRAALARFGRPARIVADRWREGELRDALVKANVPPAALEFRGMGFKDGAEDVRGFRRAVLEGKVIAAPSLLLTYAMGEARVVMDPSGNAKLAKQSAGGRRLRARDDAAAAAILAVAAGARQPAAPPRRFRYHGAVG